MKNNNSVENIIRNIKKDYLKKGLLDKDPFTLDTVGKKNEDKIIIENEIEKGLITSKEYSNPTTILPMNPYTLFLKKLILSFIRFYTKSQVVFNQNILYSANKLYQYLLHLSEKYDKNDRYYKQKIRTLEDRVKNLEKRLKRNV